MKTLNLSTNLKFPADIVTASGVLYGGKGMGKSNLGVGVIPEELYRHGLKFSIIDPLGVSYGLQYGSDRKTKGLEILIIGGKHGDIEITPTSGAVVADLVVDETVSTVIDISRFANGKMWSKAEKIRFVADYCTRLYERQGEKMEPLLLIIDEAGRFCPQMIPHGSPELARCVGAIEMLVEEGRNVGIGVLLITQRSARMNKSVSELADYMIAFRTVGPNSVSAIMDWLGEHVEKVRHKDIVGQLRELPVGSALVVSPGWLKHEGIVRFRARQTFDSSATPKMGAAVRTPGRAAKPDLDKYRERMAATIEKAKADDPSVLKREIIHLKRMLDGKPVFTPGITKETVKEIVKEVPVVAKAAITRCEKLVAKIEKIGVKFESVRDVTVTELKGLVSILNKGVPVVPKTIIKPLYRDVLPLKPHKDILPRIQQNKVDVPIRFTEDTLTDKSAKPLGKGERAILTAIAQHMDQGGASREQITVLTGYKRSSRDTYLQRLISMGYVHSMGDTTLVVTQEGKAILGPSFEPLPTGAALREYWFANLGKGEGIILRLVVDLHPSAVSREEITARTGYQRSSRDTYLQRLLSMKLLVPEGRGFVKASSNLF